MHLLLYFSKKDISTIFTISNVLDVKDITDVDVMGAELTSLRGIGYFSALTVLFCDDNQLTSLDMGYNALLEYLFCSIERVAATNAKCFIP